MEDMTACLTMDDYKKLKGLVEKCVKELTEKKDLTPAETKAMKDGLEVCDILEMKMEQKKMEDGMEYSERGYSRRNYSGHNAPYRQYHITSYGRPMYNGYSGDYGVQG